MTTPIQRYRAISQSKLMLAEILKQSTEIVGGDYLIPADLMYRIMPILRHIFMDSELRQIAEKAPEIIEIPDELIALPARKPRGKNAPEPTIRIEI